MGKATPLNRRSFVKSTALGTLGAINVLGCTNAKSVFEELIGFDPSHKPVLIDLLRHEDLLNLKLHLYNVELGANQKISFVPNRQFYMFVQLPSQHIAEELVTKLTKEDLNNKKKSFLAGSSWLVLRHLGENGYERAKINIDEAFLLDWENNFDLVTLDSLQNAKGRFSDLNLREKRELLCDIKSNTSQEQTSPLVYSSSDFGYGKQYFSSFEVPYKMFLAPIGEAMEGYKFERYSGIHTFGSNKKVRLLDVQEGPDFYKLYEIWENQLQFKAIDGAIYPPRFKVVTYRPQCGEDDDCDIELLPQPIHREELKQLTMLPFSKRDVASDFFRISAYGASTKLKYEHEQPIENTTIVSWKQQIKYARDNYVSITFRAIDVFTGIKLLVSIVSERKFKDGKSFLLKRYFISYLEKIKEFDDFQVIGKMTFKKIEALSKGAYFSPVKGDCNTNSNPDTICSSWYHVQKENVKENCESDYNHLHDIEFSYLGTDKEGKVHRFNSKIIFIPAESFEITYSQYTYRYEGKPVKTYTEGKAVSICHIGGLNPVNKEGVGRPKPQSKCSIPCGGEEEQKYSFKVTRIFENSSKVRETLNSIIAKINEVGIGDDFKSNLIGHYSIAINKEVTFADISSLQVEINGKYLVSPKSKNATFKTRQIFLFTTLPEEIIKPVSLSDDYQEIDCNKKIISDDRFSVKHPLIPFLHHAEVVIPQISQIEGVDVYRTVALTASFWSWKKKGTKDDSHQVKDGSQRTSDFAPNSINTYQLLFGLVGDQPLIRQSPLAIPRKPLKGFFSDNYRSSGGAVNPGITIKNISVLDNGITYSEELESKQSKAKGDEVDLSFEGSVDTNFIFEALEAEICGINLLKIVETSLPVEDIPVFNFIKDADETFEKIKDNYTGLKIIYEKWQKEYQDIQKSLKTAKKNLKDAEEDIQRYSRQLISEQKNGLLGQINALVEQSNLLVKQETALALFESALPEEEDLKNEYKRLKNKIKEQFDDDEYFTHLNNTLIENLSEIDFLEYYPRYPNNDEKEDRNLKSISNVIDCIDYLASRLNTTENGINDVINYIFSNFLFHLFSGSGKKVFDISNHENQLYLEVLLQEVKKMQFELNPNILELSATNKKLWKENYLAIAKGIEKAFKYCEGLQQIKIERTNCEVVRKLEKIVENHSKSVVEIFRSENKDVATLLTEINSVNSVFKKYEFYRSQYNDFREDFRDFKANPPNPEKLKDKLLQDLDTMIRSLPDQSTKDLLYRVCEFIEGAERDIFNEYDHIIERYNQFIDDILEEASEGALTLLKYERVFSAQLDEAKAIVRNSQRQIKEKEEQIKGFFDKKKQELEDEFQRQLEILKKDPRVTEAQNFVREYKQFKQKLLEATNQSLQYSFQTKKFRNADIGVISFTANENTELSVTVDYSLQFRIEDFDKPPTLVKQSYLTDTNFKDFRVTFLKLIDIHFDRIQFISGSDIKDDFVVKIRDVQFGGCLSFVDAIQEHLNALSNNLIFEVNSNGAMVNYILPPFTIEAPPFKFFNISFSALLLLPFDPKKSLQLKFGLGSELNKFGLIYLAFGGQGYFNIIVEPKQGVVGLEVVLEFGAIYHANIGGVAKGVAYLVGGIYIKKYYKNYQIKAYLLCVGRFSILGIFSASASFYLGLEGDGNRLDGVCVITFTKRFSRFFKIKIKATMRKTVYGTNKSNNGRENFANTLMAYGYDLVDTNISEVMIDKEKQFISLSFNKKDKKAPPRLSYNGLPFIPVSRNENSKKSNSEIVEYQIHKQTKSIEFLELDGTSIPVNSVAEADKNKERQAHKRRQDMAYYKSIFV